MNSTFPFYFERVLGKLKYSEIVFFGKKYCVFCKNIIFAGMRDWQYESNFFSPLGYIYGPSFSRKPDQSHHWRNNIYIFSLYYVVKRCQEKPLLRLKCSIALKLSIVKTYAVVFATLTPIKTKTYRYFRKNTTINNKNKESAEEQIKKRCAK